MANNACTVQKLFAIVTTSKRNTAKRVKEVKMSHLYMVQYGVNNSHMSEFSTHNLYRDAVSFYDKIDEKTFKSAAIIKLSFCGKGVNQKLSGKEAKIFRFEPGVDNTRALLNLCGL